MKKDEAEKAIRYLCHEWAKDRGLTITATDEPSFSDFKSWLREKGYSGYLEFRSTMGPLEDAERWFDQEFKQTWRN
ncbi:hypothetical protein P9273_03500 [Mesorhizobium sp. WSM4935]|uniref:hypothetical protein n=1 Tax=Mesorhizobium sp. WSM4935 TaxID=3038547 RepID=UPI0024152AE8|nr:hypothetical protein [Mesorhizobium sp. WSM4935]MDG4874163.1 hypothetical protein [Mesorhizobium sp. WSM4935]